MMSKLFTPIRLRELEIRNRIFLPPMCQYSAPDALATSWHLIHYGTRALGGAGLVMLEATGVAPEGRITPFDLGLWSDDQADALRPIAAFIREQGATPAIQLAHAGRKASCAQPWHGGGPLTPEAGGWKRVAPSPLPFSPAFGEPRPLTLNEIEALPGQFADAARRALGAGFPVVEVHMAHGYLLHQFLSPLTNRRDDDYGGSFDNRARLPLAVAKAVRDVWPAALPVLVRISATDWAQGGWDLSQSVRLCRKLRALGIDLIDVSTGGLLPDAIPPAAPGFQVPFADAIRAETGIATGAVGLITEARQAEEILTAGQADAVFIGRELLRNPYWPLQAAKQLDGAAGWPVQYVRAAPQALPKSMAPAGSR